MFGAMLLHAYMATDMSSCGMCSLPHCVMYVRTEWGGGGSVDLVWHTFSMYLNTVECYSAY